MGKILAIAGYELKMQTKNIGVWLVLAFALAMSLLDNFPSIENMKRLEFLTEQGYVVRRLLAQEGVLILFGLMFFISDRVRGDKKRGVMELFMASPLAKRQYILGKIFGNYSLALLILLLHLLVNALVHLIFNPGVFTFAPYIAGFFAMAVPAGFFVTAYAVALPVIMDIRLFYIVFSVYFIINIGIITALPNSIFLFQPDLLKLLFKFRFFEAIDLVKLLWNLLFLIGGGMLAILLLRLNKRFWRET